MDKDLKEILDEARKRGASKEQLKGIIDSYKSNKGLKKKDDSGSTVKTVSLDLNTQETENGSSDITSQETQPPLESSGYKEITSYINNTRVSPERIKELENQINKDYEIKNSFLGQVTQKLGDFSSFVSGSFVFGDEEEKLPTDLSKSIEKASVLLEESGISKESENYQDKLISKAKEIKLEELVIDEKNAMVRDYLTELPEDKKQKAFGYASNKMISLDSEVSESVIKLKTLEEDMKGIKNDLKDLEREANLLDERRKEIIEEVKDPANYENINTLKEQFNNINERISQIDEQYQDGVSNFNADAKEYEQYRERGLEASEDLEEFEDHVDYLKRTYGFLENINANFGNAWRDTISSFGELKQYTYELISDSASALPKPYETALKSVIGTRIKEFKDEVDYLDKVTLRSSEFIEKPYSIKDVSSVSDFLNLTGNNIIQQTPSLLMGSSGSFAPVFFAISAAGSKAKEIRNMQEDEGLEISPMEKFTSIVFAGVSEGALSTVGTVRNIKKTRKAFNSIGKSQRIAKTSEAISDITEGSLTELGEEYLVSFLDAGNKYILLDDEDSFKELNESVADIGFSSLSFGGGLRAAPHVVGMVNRIYSSSKNKLQMRKYNNSIKELIQEVNNENLSESERENSILNLSNLIETSQDFIKKNIQSLNKLPSADRKKIGELHFKIKELRVKGAKLNADDNVDSKTKKKLLDRYKNEAKKLIEQRDNIIEKKDSDVASEKETKEDVIYARRDLGDGEFVFLEVKDGKKKVVTKDAIPEDFEIINESDLNEEGKLPSMKEALQALRDIEEGTDNEKVSNAEKVIKKTPKSTLDQAQNQKQRQDIESNVNANLAEGKTEDDILEMYEGRERSIAKDVIERGKVLTEEESVEKFNKTFDKAEREIKEMNKSKLSFQNIKKSFQEFFLDRRFFSKSIFNKANLKIENTKLTDYMVAEGGSSGRANQIFSRVYDSVYKYLSKDDVKLLEKLILARRIIAIDTQRSEQDKTDIINPGNLTKADGENFISNLKKELGDKKFNRLNGRAQGFFDFYSEFLKEMYEEGFIDKSAYDSFKSYDYVQRKFLDFVQDIDENFDFSKASGDQRLSDSPLKSFKQGSEESLVTDSMLLINTYTNARAKATAANRTNKAAYKSISKSKQRRDLLSRKKEEGNISRKQVKELKALDKLFKFVDLSENALEGYRKVFFYEGGKRKSFNMRDDFYDSYAGQLDGILKNPNIREAISIVSGKAILQSFATGNNPTFFLTNTPRDLMFISVFSSEYSNFILKSVAQVAKDAINGIVQIKIGSDKSYIFKKAVDYGVMMDFLYTQGRVKKNRFLGDLTEKVFDKSFSSLGIDSKKTKDFLRFNRLGSFINDLQQYGEVGFRIGIFTRTVNNEIKRLKRDNPEKYKNINKPEDLDKLDKDIRESIFVKAVSKARGITDFNQSGTITKDIDAAVPYLNAATQSVRSATQAFEERPLSTSLRMFQMAAMTSSIPIGVSVYLLGSLDDEEVPEEFKGMSGVERFLEAEKRTSDYMKVNYMRFYTGISEEGEFEFIRLAKSHDITPFISTSENIIKKSLASYYGIEDYEDNTIEEVGFSFENNVIPFDLSLTGNLTRIPAVGASLTYTTGYDFYREQPLSYKRGRVDEVAEGFESDYIEDFYKVFGRETVTSPARIKGSVESVITSPTTNPYISLTYGLGNFMVSDKSDKSQILEDAKKTLNKSLGGRVTGKTSKYASGLTLTSEQKRELKKFAQQKAIKDFNFNKVIDDFYTGEKTVEDIKKEIDIQAGENSSKYKKMLDKLKRESKKKSMPRKVFKIKYSEPREAAMMLYNDFGGDLIQKENKDILMQLKKSGALNKEKIKLYLEYSKNMESGNYEANFEYAKNFLLK